MMELSHRESEGKAAQDDADWAELTWGTPGGHGGRGAALRATLLPASERMC